MKISQNRSGKWVIDFTCKGRRITRVIGSSKREAEAAAAAIKTDLIREKYDLVRKRQDVLFETHADEFLELYSKQNKRSWARDEISLGHLKDFFRGKSLAEITPDAIEKYKLERRTAKVSDATINRELACLKTMFSKAIEWDRTKLNPAARIKKFREANVQERILEADEMRRLLEAASPELRPILIVALNTGMRKGEILGLRWRDVDFVKAFILIEDSKSGRARKVPMNALVFDTLRGLKRVGEFVFPGMSSQGQAQPQGDVKTAFKSACRRAGIIGLRFHDLRHTAATKMIEAGVDLVTVSRILGHASIQMTMRYAHPTPENMRRAVEKLADVFKPRSQEVEGIPIKTADLVQSIPSKLPH